MAGLFFSADGEAFSSFGERVAWPMPFPPIPGTMERIVKPSSHWPWDPIWGYGKK
jgi:hypothetical protein